jgi:hypothetical protein
LKNIDGKKGSIIGLSTVIITQVILRMLDVGNISTIIAVTILAISSVLIPVFLLKNKNNKIGRKLSIFGSIIIPITFILIIVMTIFLDIDVNRQHKNFILFIFVLSFISFIIMTVFWIIAYVVVSKRD